MGRESMTPMRLTVACTAGLLVAALAFALWPGDRSLPRPVRQAIQERFPGSQVIQSKQRTRGGKAEYSVSLVQDRRRADLTVTGDGQVTRVAKDIAFEAVPRAAADALAATFPNASYRSIEEVSRMKAGKAPVVTYEALLVNDQRREIEVLVTADGTIKAK